MTTEDGIRLFYRVEEQWAISSPCAESEYGIFEYGTPKLNLVVKIFYEIKKTPKGSWIRADTIYTARDRWVSDTARKRYAYPSERQAWESFLAKKKSQVRLLEMQLQKAKYALNMAESMKEKMK